MTGLYLQRLDDSVIWEEVDQHTWDNWQFALDQKGGKRYSGNKVRKDERIHIEAKDLTTRDVAIIMRFCGVRETEAPSSVTGGFVRRPEFIRFTRKGRTTLHEINGGDFFRKRIVGVKVIEDKATHQSDG